MTPTDPQARRERIALLRKRGELFKWGTGVEYALELADAFERIEALEKDAARYQWLKQNHLQTSPDSWIRTGDDLEEAIDARLAEAKMETK